MTNPCTCKAEHWQPHADSCPAKVERPLLTLESIRSEAGFCPDCDTQVTPQKSAVGQCHKDEVVPSVLPAELAEAAAVFAQQVQPRLNPAEYGPQVVDCSCGVCEHYRKQFRDQGTPLEEYWTPERRASLKSGVCPDCGRKLIDPHSCTS